MKLLLIGFILFGITSCYYQRQSIPSKEVYKEQRNDYRKQSREIKNHHKGHTIIKTEPTNMGMA